MKFTKLFLTLGAMAALTFQADAAISVTGAGSATEAFGALPPADSWSTRSTAGNGAAITTLAQLTAAVQTNDSSLFTATLTTDATAVPGASGTTGRWNSGALHAYTRPTGNAATTIRARLQNDAGGTITSFRVTFARTAGAPITEQVDGHQVYYSVGGSPGSWVHIPSLSGGAAGTITDVISPSGWSGGSSLYILFVDDNADPGTDGSFTIDDFVISEVVFVSEPTTIGFSSPTNNHPVAVYADLTVATVTTGSITNVDFLVDGVFIVNDTTFPFGGTVMIPGATPLGPHTLTAVATDTTGAMVTSTGVTFIVVANTPPQIAITNTFSGTVTGTTFLVGSPVTVQAGFSDDDAITNIAWYVNDWLYLSNRINGQWVYLNALAGTTVLQGVASDRAGNMSTSSVTLTITNPPANQYTLLLTNGSDWRYYIPSTSEPPNLGVPWPDFFYDDSGVDWATGLAELGNGDIPNGYAERTLIDIGPANPRFTTMYFRKSITVDDPTFYPNVALRLLRDDGGVVYLNGVAVWTNNMTPTASPVPYGDFAAASDDGVNYQVFNLPNPVTAPVLFPGLNVVAVEIHQQNATSSDLSFDLMIWGETNLGPTVVITSPTNGQSFRECEDVPITATASTFVTNVDFYVDGNLIGSDGTSPYSATYSNTAVGTRVLTAVAQDGFGGTANSPAVTITITPNAPPSITITNVASVTTGVVFLVGSAITNQYGVSDDVGVTAVETYIDGVLHFRDTAGFGQVIVNDAIAGVHTYTVVAYDACNGVSSNSVTVTVTNPPLALILTNGAEWRYEDSGDTQAVAWVTLGFDDSGWSNGVAELGFGDAPGENNPEKTVIRRNSGLFDTNSLVYYFRKIINVADPNAYGSLIVNILRDDGALVYINGNPVLTNSQNGAYPPTAAAADDGTRYFSGNVPASALVAGQNIVAVEVRQNNAGSSDLSFDLMIWGTAPVGPTLSIALEGSDVRITWTGGGTLQFTDNMNDNPVWQDQLTGQQGPGNYLIPANQAHRFYSLRQ